MVTIIALAYALAAYGSGMDRMSGVSPSLERLVPGPFRSNAHLAHAALALSRGNHIEAESSARKAISAAPASHRASAQLGAAQLFRGRNAEAQKSFRAAALFGWRDPLTQAYWFNVAMAGGDLPRAAERLDALLRVNPAMAETRAAVILLENTAAGRGAIAARAAHEPDWLTSLLNTSRGLPDGALLRRADTIDRIAARSGPLGCKRVSYLAMAMLDRGMITAAGKLWRNNCDRNRNPGGLVDTNFVDFLGGEGSGVFGWRRRANGDIGLGRGRNSDDTAALLADNTGPSAQAALVQQLWLPPGKYQVSAAISDPEKAALSLDCGAGRRPSFGARGPVTVDMMCSRQTLILWLAADAADVTVSRVSVQPARTSRDAPTAE